MKKATADTRQQEITNALLAPADTILFLQAMGTIINTALKPSHLFAQLCQFFTQHIPFEAITLTLYAADGRTNIFEHTHVKENSTRLNTTQKVYPLFHTHVPVGLITFEILNLTGFEACKNLLQHIVVPHIALAFSYLQAREQLTILALDIAAREEENMYLQEQIQTADNYSEIIGTSEAIQKVFYLVSNVAPSDSTVLILGETGTGKELVARAIHQASPRKDKLMVKLNCATLPADLIESELFGHEKGSFTGATERRIGKFELAHNGTLFLDEVGELPLELQVKLLRALQEKEIERIGGKGAVKVNVRIIAATNRNLYKEMQAGTFRSDLFYRLNVFPITVPPLRERKEDIAIIAQHFIARYAKKTGKNIQHLAKKALKTLMTYHWPGNLRELEHLVERSVLLTNGSSLQEIQLPKPAQQTATGKENFQIKSIYDNERDHIMHTLRMCNGKISGTGGAAAILNIPPTTLNSKIKKFRIKREHLLPLLLPFLFCIFSLLPVNKTQAQSRLTLSEADLYEMPSRTLHELYDSTQPDRKRLKILIVMSQKLISKPGEFPKDLDSASACLWEMLELNKSIKSYKWQLRTMQLLGVLYCEYEKHDSAQFYFLKSIDLARENKNMEDEAETWETMGQKIPMFRNELLPRKAEALTHAYELYKSLKQEKEAIYNFKDLADVHFNQGKYDLAEKELNEVLVQYKAIHYTQLHYTYDLLSAVNRMKGDLPKSLSYAIMACNSMEATNDTSAAGYFYRRMADTYRDIGNNAESLVYARKAFDFFKRNNSILIYPQLIDVADGMLKEGDAKGANDLVNETMKHYPTIGLPDKGAIMTLKGDCYNAMKQYDDAERYYLKALKTQYQEVQSDYLSLYYKLGEFYIAQKKYTQAVPFLNKLLAGKISEHSALSRLKDVHLLMFKVDSATGHPAQAIDQYQEYTRLKDSLLNNETTKQIEELQIKFKTREKDKDNQLLRKQSQLQQKEIQKSDQLRRFTFAGILLLLLFLVLLYNRYAIKQKSNLKLQSQQREIQAAYTALKLSLTQKNKLLTEKEWLLKEIHHRVKNNLQLVISLLNTQTHYLQNDAAILAINESRYRLRSISLIHQKLYQSDAIATIDMQYYILQLVEFLRDSFGSTRIDFDIDVQPVQADVSVAVPVGLIMNEAITNIFKYAYPQQQAGKVRIALVQIQQELILTISDDGVGLPADFNLDKDKSMGFTLMKGLSLQLGGKLEIVSEKGVSIRLAFSMPEQLNPLQEEANALT